MNFPIYKTQIKTRKPITLLEIFRFLLKIKKLTQTQIFLKSCKKNKI